MEFWNRVIDRIKDQKTSQRWVAEKIGVRPDSFSRWITTGVLPNVAQAVKIAEALDTTVEALVANGGVRQWGLPLKISDIVDDLLTLDSDQLNTVGLMIQGLRIKNLGYDKKNDPLYMTPDPRKGFNYPPVLSESDPASQGIRDSRKPTEPNTDKGHIDKNA